MAGPVIMIDRAPLLAALRDVAPIAPRNGHMDILANLLIEAGADGSLRLSASNIDVLARRTISAAVPQAGTTTISAQRLSQIVAATEEGAQVKVDASASGTASIVSGRARFRVGTLPANHFPPMPFGEPAAAFEMDAAALRRALTAVQPSICRQESRYWLCGVYIHAAVGQLNFVSTDGDRMSRVTLPAPAGAEALGGMIVSPAFVSILVQATDGEEGAVRLEFGESKVRASLDGFVVTARAIDGTFPDYTRAVSSAADWAASVEVDRPELEAALARILLVSDGKDRGRVTRFDFAADRLTLSTVASADEAVEELACALSGEPFAMGLLGSHVREAVRTLGGERVAFGVVNPMHPAMITSPTRADASLSLSGYRL